MKKNNENLNPEEDSCDSRRRNSNSIEESIDFVGRNYRRDAFPEREVWRSLGVHRLGWWRRGRNIAAIAVGVTLTAAASVMIFNHTQQNQSQPVKTEQVTAPVSVDPLREVRRIDFEDASLPSVVAEIERIYGVKISGGEDASIRVSLSYEGNVTELLETINSLFGTQLAIETGVSDSQPDKR